MVFQLNGTSSNDPLYQFHRHAKVKAKPLSGWEMECGTGALMPLLAELMVPGGASAIDISVLTDLAAIENAALPPPANGLGSLLVAGIAALLGGQP